MKQRYIILVVIFILLNTGHLYSGQVDYQIDDYIVNGNSLSSRINSISQDKSGFLWIGTQHGLYKYDGYYFSKYLPSQSITDAYVSDTINCVYCDVNNKVLVGLQNGGLVEFDAASEKFSRILNTDLSPVRLTGNTVSSILKDKLGNKWILTDRGIDKIDKYHKVHKYYFSTLLNTTRRGFFAQSMTTDFRGNIWIAFHGTLCRFNTKTNRLSVFPSLCSSEFNITRVSLLKNNKLAVGTNRDGILVVDLITGETSNFRQPDYHSNSSAVNSINSLFTDHAGNLWCGSGYGLHQLSTTKFLHFSKTKLIPEANLFIDQVITSVYEDQSGVIWAGNSSGELHKLSMRSQPFVHHLPNNSQGLIDTKVNAFKQDKTGIMWIGTRKGLCWLNPRTGHYIQIPATSGNLINLNEISRFFEARDRQSMLVSTWSRTNAFSVYSYATGKFQHFSFSNKELNTVGSVVKTHSDYYAATFGNGLLKIIGKPETTKPLKYSKYSNAKLNLLYGVFYDRNNRLWILGFQNGLGMLNSNTGKMLYFRHSADSNSLSDNRVCSAYEDAKNRIWIGTHNGLNLYQPESNSFKRFYPESASADTKILGIVSDNYNNLWMMQDHQILKFNPITQSFQFFNIRAWIPNCIFQEGAIGTDKDGTIYFGTKNNGFITVSPDKMPDILNPSVSVSGLFINNQRIKSGQEVNGRIVLNRNINSVDRIKLTYKENLISIEFSALSFLNPSENRYAYKLENYQDNWVYTSAENNKAIFSNLPPGEYVFKIRAANYLGLWNSTEKKLIIEVATPPWLSWWAILFYILILTAAIFAYIRYKSNKLKITQALEFERFEKNQIQQLNQQKMKFFTNVSHEFRTPLTLISTYNRKILENIGSSQKIYPWVVNTQQNTEQLLLLVNQLLDFRKLEEHQTRLQVAEHDIVKFSYSLFQLFSDLSRLKEIDYRFKSNCESALVWFDKQKVERILFNLLSNAFKFTGEGETIHVSLSVEMLEGQIILEVSDTGLGIPVDEIHRIFDSFYQSASNVMDQNTGTGIGLAFVKQLVELHRGTITVESEKGKGSLFTVCLPACKESYDAQEFSTAVAIETVSQQSMSYMPGVEAKELTSEDAPLILVVEDNAELRHLLVHDLLCEYRVLEAGDGAEGLEMVWEHNPDLIISDVLMPEKDGFELCKELKNDLRSSHIPVILLTAMAMGEKKLEGFRSGADDYIEKPFSPELFILKIRNLLDTRRRLKILYAGDNLPEVQNVTLSPLDASFFEQAEAVIEQNLSNCDFDVDEFCKEMELGQKLVYRKIKSLTGLSISEYIRHERLKWAATLLREQRYTVQEVSYKVGFATPSYFAKCFKKQFGIAPKDYK